MLKLTFAAAAVCLLAAGPAFADDKLMCDDASMGKVKMMIDNAMKNPDMKKAEDMAMKESDMAMMAKKDGKMDDCAMHLNMASDAMMKGQ